MTEVCNTVLEALTKTIPPPPPKKKKCKKAKYSEEALQIVEDRREVKRKAERERYTQVIEFRVPKNSKERQEGLLQ